MIAQKLELVGETWKCESCNKNQNYATDKGPIITEDGILLCLQCFDDLEEEEA